MVRKIILPILILVAIFSLRANAQIGYQVALLNAADGQPRAFETVNVTVTLTDSTGTEIYKETKSTTSNEFGILSLSIGNSDMFNDMNWSNLPLYVSASVDGVLLGKSQVLSVPVAEHSKHTGTLTKEILCSKKWVDSREHYYDELTFSMDGTVVHVSREDGIIGTHTFTGTYVIRGDMLALIHVMGAYGGAGIIKQEWGPGLYNSDKNEIYFYDHTFK